ncbi:MAG: NINE protein [Bacteroidales bacterium]
MFCKRCGKEISDNAFACPQCGEPTNTTQKSNVNFSDASDKEWITTLLLCIFLGGLGAHNFYTGKTVIGIIQLLTLGACGVWTLIDLIMILTKSFKDSENRLVIR